jgi:hypothetical protein
LGIRAHDDGHMEMLAFLFLTPANTSQTAASCRQAELDQISKDSGGRTKLQALNPDGKDTRDIATMSMIYPGERVCTGTPDQATNASQLKPTQTRGTNLITPRHPLCLSDRLTTLNTSSSMPEFSTTADSTKLPYLSMKTFWQPRQPLRTH